MSCGQAVTSTRALSSSSNSQQHSSNTRFESTRAALEHTSMSRFPRMAYCTAENTHSASRSIDCSSATSTRQTQTRRGQAITGTRALINSSSSSSSSSGSTQRHSRNTRLEQHSYACCCCCLTAAFWSGMNSSSTNSSSTAVCCCSCSKKWEKNKIATTSINVKIRASFQDPGWLSGSGTPSPELLAG